MRPELLMDAMEYIDEDLLAAADRLRTGGKRYTGWLRWASLAACVCILAGGMLVWSRLYRPVTETETAAIPETEAVPTVTETLTTETAAETDEQMDGEEIITDAEGEAENVRILPENVQIVRTDGYHEDVQYPVITLIRSAAELQVYYEANRDLYDMERKETVYSDTTIGFADACDRYDAAYFETHDLLLILLEEGSGSIRHEVGALLRTEEGWLVEITHICPELCTDDMAQWHIMIETEKNLLRPEETIALKEQTLLLIE